MSAGRGLRPQKNMREREKAKTEKKSRREDSIEREAVPEKPADDFEEPEKKAEEEDAEAEETPQGGRMSLSAHLTELRKRLMICIIVFLLFFTLCLGKAEWFTNLLLSRGENFSFVYIAPAELLMSYIKVAMAGGVIVTVPFVGYELWQFIRPGLRRGERFGFLAVMLAGLILFALGAVFAFAIVLPILLGFFARLNTTGTVTAMVSVQEYISYLLSTMITFGIIFETPMVMTAATGFGFVRPQTLEKNFKYVVLIILTVAAIITPPDVTSQILVALPLMVLFYASILFCKLLFRKKLREREDG